VAQGDLRGNLTASVASVTNPTNLTGSVAVSVGDLIYVAFSQQTALTATSASDNLGNTYSAVNAGTDGGTPTHRAFYARVTTAGTLTTISVAATASTNDASAVAAVIEGPFMVGPLDANPANTTDGTTPFTCPATGTLAQAEEVIMASIGINSNQTVAASSPFTLSGTVARANISTGVSRQKVSATTTQTPEFTGTTAAAVQTTASFKLARLVTADPGSFTVSGTAANLEHGREIAADGGSYSITGTDATLVGRPPGIFDTGIFDTGIFDHPSVAKTLSAGAGAFAFTGTDASLERGFEVAAGAGAFAFTGTDASLEYGREVAGGAGSYAVTGTDANLEYGREVLAGAGSYAVTGTDANLEFGREVLADAGAFAFTGTDASLEYGFEVLAGAGSYAFTGVDAALEYGRELAAGAGSYAFTGTDATLLYSGGAKVLGADAGSYAFTGTDANLEYGREIAADAGAYAYTGQDANLEYGREIAADAGAYAYTGQDATLTYAASAKAIVAEPGAFTFTGTDATLEYAAANQNVPPPRRYGSGQYGEPAKLILSWMPQKKRKKDEKAKVEIVEDAIEQALEAAPVALPINPEQVELAARLLLAEYGLAELRRIKYAETLLLRIEQVMAEMDDEEVLLLAA